MRACLTSPTTGCPLQDLRAFGASTNEMCGYFNQTGYEAYRDCGKLLFSFVTYADHKGEVDELKKAVKVAGM